MGSAVDVAAPRRQRRMEEGPACSGTLSQRPVGFRKGDQGGTWWGRWEQLICSTQEKDCESGLGGVKSVWLPSNRDEADRQDVDH